MPNLIGTAPNQVSTNGMLGTAAFINTEQLPVSAPQQAALDAKAPLASPTFTGTVSGITKAMVGLGNVDNTADSAKVVASAQKLTTARTINGVSFDGTANITVTDGTKMPLSGGTFTGLTYFPNGRLRATGSFNIDGSEPNATGHDDGLYVVDFGGTSGTTQNPAFAAAIVGRLSNTRNVALTVDAGGYIYGFRTHTALDTYTWRSKVKYADRLTTTRTINGTLFDGSANITTADWGTSRTLTLGATGKAVNGSANVSWTLSEIGAQAESANLTAWSALAPDAKQAALVSGTNIKTINGNSLLGSGDLEVGYKNIPQNSQSAAYTLVLEDAGKHIFHPAADTTARTFTIPANSSVAYPIGTAITFINQNGTDGVVSIGITTDTMRLAGAGTTGTRTLARNGVATAVKITATEWIISGTGLT